MPSRLASKSSSLEPSPSARWPWSRHAKAEKADVVERLAQDISDAWPGIEKSPEVSGGAACIVRSRIAVWMLESYRRLGWTEARILANYPALRAADLVHAWAYVDARREEIEAAIQENEAA